MKQGNAEGLKQKLNAITARVIGAAMEIHRELGPGLWENTYKECLAYEFSKAGLLFARERRLPVQYKELRLDCGYKLDFVIEDGLIVEVKAVTELQPIHEAQMLTYLKLHNKPLGLIINFNVLEFKQGVRRIASGDLFKQSGPNFTFRVL